MASSPLPERFLLAPDLTDLILRQRYQVHEWTDGAAVFDLATGDTHVLDASLARYFMAHFDGRLGNDAAAASAYDRLAQMDLLG